MAIENGEWIMRGMDWDDPARIQSWEELIGWIDEIGFLPLFKNEVDGFSVEENTADLYWWSGDPEQDPWEWRCLMARSGRVAYGSFLGRRLVSSPRRGFPTSPTGGGTAMTSTAGGRMKLAPMRQKRIMDCFAGQDEWFSFALKQRAGFGKGGEKNFEGTVTDLQMGGYLLIRDFRQRINKKGAPYGWPISVYTTPEALWGYEHIASAYSVDPAESKALIYEQVRKDFPEATQKELDAVLGWTR